jgi:hypothetical protein
MEKPLVNERLAEGYPQRVVHGEDIDRHAPDGGTADENRSVPPKVALPPVPARVEEPNELRPGRDPINAR